MVTTHMHLLSPQFKQKYEMQSEEWERAILQKNNDPLHVPKKGLFKNNKTQAQVKPRMIHIVSRVLTCFNFSYFQLNKLEEDARMKATMADQNYRQQLQATNASRQDYFQFHLPKILSALKDIGDECCVALRYQLARYAYIYEQALTADGLALDNDDGLGLRSLTEKIDKDGDMIDFIKSYSTRSTTRTHKQEIPFKEYSMSPTALSALNPNPVFGVDLNILMERDREEVPLILRKCAEAIETYGLNTVGIYRISGVNTQIQKLRAAFDRGELKQWIVNRGLHIKCLYCRLPRCQSSGGGVHFRH